MFNAYFTDYCLCTKNLKETKGKVNEVWIDSIKKVLSKLKRIIEYAPKNDAFTTEENDKIIYVAKKFL